MTEGFTFTNYGLAYILQKGCGALYYTLDNDNSAESKITTSPASELSGNGAGRQQATYTDKSSGSTISVSLKTVYTFSGVHAINAICVCSSPSAGPNMAGRGLLSAVQNVGNQDTVTIELTVNLNQVTS